MICQKVVAGDFLLAKYSHRALTAGKWYEVSRVDNSYPSRIPRYHLKEISGSAPWHPFWFGLTDTVGSEEIAGAEAHVRHADSPAGSLADNQQPAEDPDEWIVQDRVPIRDGMDQGRYQLKETRPSHDAIWYALSDMNMKTRGLMHGATHPYDPNCMLFVRCRRRDLPKVEPPEQWPKYYKIEDTDIAYMIRLSATKLRYVYKDGSTGVTWTWSEEDEAAIREEITEAEAMALLNPKQCAVGCHGPRCPNPALPGKDHCGKCADEPQPQKTRVRLFASFGAVHMRMPGEITEGIGREVKHDSEGFYVEGGQS